MKPLIYILILISIISSFAGVMPHWHLWRYKVNVSSSKEICQIEVTPYFLGVFRMSIDKVIFYEPSLQINTFRIGSKLRVNLKCGSNFSLSYSESKEKDIEYLGAHYSNPVYFDYKSLPGFLVESKEVYFSCYNSSTSHSFKEFDPSYRSHLFYEMTRSFFFECNAIKKSSRDF